MRPCYELIIYCCRVHITLILLILTGKVVVVEFMCLFLVMVASLSLNHLHIEQEIALVGVESTRHISHKYFRGGQSMSATNGIDGVLFNMFIADGITLLELIKLSPEVHRSVLRGRGRSH